jgi:hypothetical protein
MREWEDLSNWFYRSNTKRLPLLSNNSDQERKKKTICVPFRPLHFGCQMHQTTLPRRKATLPWAPLKEACQQAVQCKHFKHQNCFPRKNNTEWIYLYTKMRYYADSCVEMPKKCVLESAFDHCNENPRWENFDTYGVTWRSGHTFVKQLIQVTRAFSSSETNNGTTTWYATLRYIENPEYSTVKQVVM